MTEEVVRLRWQIDHSGSLPKEDMSAYARISARVNFLEGFSSASHYCSLFNVSSVEVRCGLRRVSASHFVPMPRSA